MELFQGQNLLEFAEYFKTDLDCKEYLSEMKWKDTYSCVKCGHKKAKLGEIILALAINAVILSLLHLIHCSIK